MEDTKIIELFCARSEQAVSELDQKYGRLCHKLSYNILNNHDDADECVNDTYLGVWNAIPPAKPNPLQSYICKIVRNISLKLYERQSAVKRSSNYGIAMEELEEYLPSANTVEAEIETKELAQIIQRFLDTLTEENCVIFLRRYWFCDNYQEIAKRVGLTEKTVSVRLTRIRKQMKNYLLEREVFL